MLTCNIPAPGGIRKEEIKCQTPRSLTKSFKGPSKDGFDAPVSSFGEANKGFQAIAAEVTAYSKKSFEDGTRAFEQLLAAKSLPQVFEIQSQYARMAYEGYVAELSKLGEMYAGLTRNAYKPVEQAVAKSARKVA